MPLLCCACQSWVFLLVAPLLPSNFAARLALYELDERSCEALRAIGQLAKCVLPSAINQFIASATKLPTLGPIYVQHKEDFKRTELAQFEALLTGKFDAHYIET
jgi:hypothetical protein